MEENIKDTEGKENAKMSYEQLENVAHQLSEQVRQLYAKLQESNLENMFKRLDYLFRVVENAHSFSVDFVNKCTSEIESLMTLPDPEDEPKEDSGQSEN
nr:MAG TPA: hypothetical protein [Crassvirales sp.]